MTEKRTHSSAESDVAKRLLDRVKTHDRMTCGSDQALGYYSAWDAQLMRDAADEIERLRHDLDRHMQIAVDVLNDAQAVPEGEFEQVFMDACVEAGCGYDNELLLTTIKEMRDELQMRRISDAMYPSAIAQPASISTDDIRDAVKRGWDSAAGFNLVSRISEEVGRLFIAPQPSPAATVATKSAPVLIASHQSEGLPSSDAAGAGADTHSSAATEHASWDDANYQRARDTMVDILRRNSGWSITTGDLTAFDNAFQHAVGILSLTARRLPDEPQRLEVTAAMVDAALNAWFKSPPSETDQGLERSMKAALVAASLTSTEPQAVNECPEYLDDATDWVPLREAPVVTDADVERAWAAMVGNDVASMCHQASVVRGDIRTALQSYALSRPEHLSPSASSPAGPAPSQRPSE